MLQEIAVEEFEALLGQPVAVEGGGHRLQFEIASVRRLASPSPRPQSPFSVVLRENAATRVLPQGIYRVEHPQCGALELFIVPIGPDGKGMCYEITFN